MKTYEITIKPKSSFVTSLQSDTIFGHICWAYRYRNGEDKLIELLENIKGGKTLLISSAFPVGYLPKPKIKPLLQEERETIIYEKFGNERLDAFQAIKKSAKKTLIKKELFIKHINNLSEKGILSDLLNEESQEKKKGEEFVLKNTINRNTFTVVEDGGLHGREEKYFDSEQSIYFSSNILTADEFVYLLNDISLTGFGKKKSTGKGQFEIVGDPKDANLPKVDEPNAFMTLSNYVPSADEQVDGWYELFTKYPKVGGEFAVRGHNGGSVMPYKNPILMFAPGSVFKTNTQRNTYGQLLNNVYPPLPNVVQYGFAFPLEVRVNE